MGIADLDRSTPGSLTAASVKARLPGAVAHDDSLWRGEFTPRGFYRVIGNPNALNHAPIEAELRKSTPIWDDLGWV